MKNPFGELSLERGKKIAFRCGAEYQANPGSNRREYLNDASFYFREGVKNIRDLTGAETTALIIEFSKGIEAEKALQ